MIWAIGLWWKDYERNVELPVCWLDCGSAHVPVYIMAGWGLFRSWDLKKPFKTKDLHNTPTAGRGIEENAC